MTYKLEQVGGKYGAPQGRADWLPADRTALVKLYLERMRLVDYDYDRGGAYWGGSAEAGDMYVAHQDVGDTTVRIFMRGKSREDAKANIRKVLPAATFYR